MAGISEGSRGLTGGAIGESGYRNQQWVLVELQSNDIATDELPFVNSRELKSRDRKGVDHCVRSKHGGHCPPIWLFPPMIQWWAVPTLLTVPLS
jgi:hypothetical protein